MPNKSSIFGIQKSSDQDLTYIINTLKALLEQFIVVHGDGLLGLAAQQNVTMAFRLYLLAALNTRQVSKRHHLNHEAFNWVLGEIKTKFNWSITLGARGPGNQ